MSDTVEELTIQYEEGDLVKIKELDKKVLTKGAWTTIMFLHQDWDARSDKYSEPKVTIRRYQKREGRYQQKSKFTISNEKQAREVAKVLVEWYDAQ